MKMIPLTQGKVALVDDADYELLCCFKWFSHWDRYNWYAVKKNPTVNGVRSSVTMHAFLLNPPPLKKIDHEDHNGLNNQRINLRICTHAQNLYNKRMSKNNRSGLKGVCWNKKLRKWIAQIRHNKVMHLGVFADKCEAAKTYDEAAIRCFGQFALTNKKLGLL